jgi:hypothetical protein
MRDFLTDGSVSALCDELAKLLRAPIWLRDQSSEVIIPVWSDDDSAAGGGHPWSIVTEAAGRERAFALVDRTAAECHEPLPVPLRIRAGLLGAIVLCVPKDAAAPQADAIRRALGLLASSVCDVCEAQWTLRQRIKELDALYRLSSMLSVGQSASTGPSLDADKLLESALALAIETLGVDAGSVALIEDGREAPVIRASRGLSRNWTSDTETLSRHGVLRQAALRGEVICVEDLLRDPRIEATDRIRTEGLVSLITTGLRDQGTPIGLIRLYTRRARVFTPAEGELLKAIAEHAAAAVTTARLRKLREQDGSRQACSGGCCRGRRRMFLRSMSPRTTPRHLNSAATSTTSLSLAGTWES